MKSRRDLLLGLVAKAKSDLENATLCVENEVALDTACFHCQQAAEKMLKAFLTLCGVEYPFVHNLPRLVALCMDEEPMFRKLIDDAAALTPFAVSLRYDHEFWPSLGEAKEARSAALRIMAFCEGKLKTDDEPEGGRQ